METQRLKLAPWADADIASLRARRCVRAVGIAPRGGHRDASEPRFHQIMEKLGMQYEKRMEHRGVEVVLYAVERPCTAV